MSVSHGVSTATPREYYSARIIRVQLLLLQELENMHEIWLCFSFLVLVPSCGARGDGIFLSNKAHIEVFLLIFALCAC